MIVESYAGPSASARTPTVAGDNKLATIMALLLKTPGRPMDSGFSLLLDEK